MFVPSLQADKIVPTQNLYVPTLCESILGTHEARVLLPQGALEPLHPLQKNNDLIRGPALDVPGLRSEFGIPICGSRFPFRSKRVADVDERGVEIGFGREAGGVEPSVPIYGFECGGGGRIGGKEINEILFELLRVEGFACKRRKILVLGEGRGQSKQIKEPGGKEKMYMRDEFIPLLLAKHFL